MLVVLLAGCASVPPQDRTPLRLSEAELAKATPAAQRKPTLEELAADAKRGVPTDAIIGWIKSSGARWDLSPSQALELHRQGLPLAVLDHLHAAWASARNDDQAASLNARDARCRQALEQQKAEARQDLCPYPPGWYDPWWPGGVRGGYLWRH